MYRSPDGEPAGGVDLEVFNEFLERYSAKIIPTELHLLITEPYAFNLFHGAVFCSVINELCTSLRKQRTCIYSLFCYFEIVLVFLYSDKSSVCISTSYTS